MQRQLGKGCSGGFSAPGVLRATQPLCDRRAGNSSTNPDGVGCGYADLCAAGLHICAGALEVAAKSPTGCAGAAPTSGLFFATRQGSTGCADCTLGTRTNPSVCSGCSCAQNCAPSGDTANDVWGCGTLGKNASNCGVLDGFSFDLCTSLPASWNCGTDSCHEASHVTKQAGGGGVLCCAD
ncbi:MAG: hypothetical protein MUF54_22500 [Polyangiaceae bacterium]|jgi:hypothetical protein|nr:hypothetical protein [Polyangiaceae bacterium]